ncbi:MAG: sensor domain-containing phosphodiesterase [Clostridia bacterium]|nr:sensor domain-containing phosphodiesterase [Clostridia bacterium]
MEYKDYNSLVMDRSGSIGYICDMETYEILYLSRACMEICGLSSPEEYRSQKCHKVLYGLDEPCPFCTNARLSSEEDYNWEHYNEKLGRWFDITDSLVLLEGNLCRLEIARDITTRKAEMSILADQLSLEDMLFRCLNTLTRERDVAAAFHQFLQLVGSYYQANRAYIIEFRLKDQVADNTFEWCAPGVSAEIDNLQGVPLSVMDDWVEKFETVGEFSINSIREDLAPDAEDRRILEAQGIQSLLAAPLRRDGQIVGFVGVDDPTLHIDDLTLLRAVSGFVLEELEKRRLLAELEEMSYIDVLTGLKNRNRYTRVLQEYESAPPLTLGVIVLDINGLREINDTHGFAYGDRVLKQAAGILSEHFSGSVYRIGGDEFTVLCENISREAFQFKVVELRAAFEADPLCDVSIGFAWNLDADSVDVNALRHQAHEMRRAEKQAYYHSVLNEGRMVSRSGIAGEVVQEIADGRFVVYYQPQVDLKSGAVVGAEALVRKIADDGSIIPPGKFISFYEVGGVISYIDRYVLRTACQALRQWMDQGYQLHISVNFSRVTLLERSIVEEVSAICEEERVPTSCITIEVTESIGKMDGEYLKQLIDRLRAAGFSISLDDFGSQYSNLAILAELDFDEVKFDRSLINSLEQNKKSRLVIESGLGLCRAMEGTTSLAEGIETQGQLDLLASFRCDYGQGYYFSRPVPLCQFEEYLQGHNPKDV